MTSSHFTHDHRVEREDPERLRSDEDFVVRATAVQHLEAEREQPGRKQPLFIQLKPSQAIHTYAQQQQKYYTTKWQKPPTHLSVENKPVAAN